MGNEVDVEVVKEGLSVQQSAEGLERPSSPPAAVDARWLMLA